MEDRKDWGLVEAHMAKSPGLGARAVAHFGVLYKGSDELGTNNFPCHAQARHASDSHRTFVNVITERKPTEATSEWVKWIMSEDSPFRGVQFLCSPEEALETRAIAISGLDSTPSNLLFEFLVATRFTTEVPERGQLWLNLVNKGEDPALACMCALADTNRSHSIFPTSQYIMDEFFVNFVKRKPVELWEPWNVRKSIWHGGRSTHDTWGRRVFPKYSYGRYPLVREDTPEPGGLQVSEVSSTKIREIVLAQTA